MILVSVPGADAIRVECYEDVLAIADWYARHRPDADLVAWDEADRVCFGGREARAASA